MITLARRPILSPAFAFAAALSTAVLFGCATPPPEEDAEARAAFEELNDPLEPTNRAVFQFNQFLDELLIKPLALLYRFLIPPEPRRGIRNALANARTPVILANDLLQGKPDRAGTTLKRFAINTTIGLGGFLDVASDMGIEGHNEDFGQTLAVWGVGEGPYLMLPLFGPSNPRHAAGLAVDTFLDPLVYFADTAPLAGRTATVGVDEREQVVEELEEIERTSLDFYATLRSMFRQRRASEIRDGEAAPMMQMPRISFEEDVDEGQFTLR